MRRYPSLRPDLYARLVNQTISDVHARQAVLDVEVEADRISQECGIAMRLVARDITASALSAGVPLELGTRGAHAVR